MSKKCIYCKVGLDDSSVIDFCQRCGVGVWGEKMFATIVDNMEGARDAGDLYQGSVTNDSPSQVQNPIQKSPSFETQVRSSQRVDEFRGDSSKSESNSITQQPNSNSLAQDAIKALELQNTEPEEAQAKEINFDSQPQQSQEQTPQLPQVERRDFTAQELIG